MSDYDIIFTSYPTAEWSVGGVAIKFPVQRLEERGGNRIVKHKRVYRDGARCDDMGSEPKGWTFTCAFFNSPDKQEPGLDLAQYPDNVNKLLATFDTHETGDLTIPTRGTVRARAESYTRVESNELRDACVCTLTWVADNEDDGSQAAFTAPSAAAVIGETAEEAVGAAADLGALSEDLTSLSEFASSLEALAAAPAEFVADMEAQAYAMESAVSRIETAFASAAGQVAAEVKTLLTDPAASMAGRRLRKAADQAASLTTEKVGLSTNRVITRTWARTMSIFEVAIEVNQDAGALMGLNTSLPDMLSIAPGTPVRMYASTTA